MRGLYFIFVFLCFSCFANGSLEQQLPKAKGSGPDILLLNGGRPWTGSETAAIFQQSGFRVTTLDSSYLAGLGGAPIRFFLTDKFEPKPFDGITPAFQKLGSYKLVVINAMSAENQRKLLTPERIRQLEKYVANGGSLLLTVNSPDLKGLSPVVPGAMYNGTTTAVRPAGKRFSFLPEKWQNMAGCRQVSLREGSEADGAYLDGNGKKVAPLFAVRNVGKGKVVFWNADYVRGGGVRQMFYWAYSKGLFLALVSEAGGFGVPGTKAVYQLPAVSAPKQLKALALKVMPPVMEMKSGTAIPEIKKTSNGAFIIKFKSGLELTARPDNWINVSGGPGLLTQRLLPLKASSSQSGVALDINTAEAAGSGAKQRIRDLKLKLTDAKGSPGMVELEYRQDDGSRIIRAVKEGSVNIDGTEYSGFAEQVRIPESKFTWESIAASSFSRTAKGLHGRCFSCYTPPRGYKEIDFSGAGPVKLETWNFFANGQPFAYAAGPDGISLNFVSGLQPFFIRQYVPKTHRQYIVSEYRWQFGRRKAPLETVWYWHTAGRHRENWNNQYIGAWQFVRHILRKAAGLKEIPARPLAVYQNVCNPAEIDKTAATAARLGFRQMFLPLCPTGLEFLNGARCVKLYGTMKKHGLTSRPWSPCDYTHGDSEKIMANKDWFLLDHHGKIVRYFGKHPVLDLNSEAFRSWYRKLMKEIISYGVGGIYMDMGGTSSVNVSYRGEESMNGLDGLLKNFRFFNEKNLPVGVEGMNPLVQDSYWYRQRLYQPVSNREYQLLGAQLGTHLCGDDLAIDYFRAAMYGCMMQINVDGYALNFERTPNELKLVERIGRLNPAINLALDTVGMPFIREIPAGTLWVSSSGAAVFCRDKVEKLDLSLPDGWKIIHGKTEKIEPDSIIIITNTATRAGTGKKD